MVVTHGGDIFAIARQHNWDWHDVLDFSANINPLGPSPRVGPAICAALDRIAHYPERDSPPLRHALGEKWSVDPTRILLGNGATELIFFLARFFTDVTLALPVFSEFHRAFPQARTASLTDPSTWPAQGLLVLTRPANPTGWTLPLEQLRHVRATMLIDESFLEFSGQPSAATLNMPNILVLRSLTKFYALPGLRIGALIGDLDRTRREPWQVNVLAEAAALAALADTEHAARSLELVETERTYLARELNALSSDANFLFVPFPHPASLKHHLLQHKILIRDDPDWPGVRIAVRPRAENNRLLAAWKEFRT